MGTLVEIEAAIERLPAPDVEELSRWLAERPKKRTVDVEAWLQLARSAATPGVTTESILTKTRGEE